MAPIAPSLKPEADDNFRNASASPVNGDAVTTFGDATAFAGLTSPQGLVYNRDAYVLVMADLYKPTRSVDVSERISNTKLGISIRFLKGYDIINDKAPARLTETGTVWGNASGTTGSSTTGITINNRTATNQNAGSVTGTNAPYVQLLACQKQ